MTHDCPHCHAPRTVPETGPDAWTCTACGEDGRVCSECEAPHPVHEVTADEVYCSDCALRLAVFVADTVPAPAPTEPCPAPLRVVGA